MMGAGMDVKIPYYWVSPWGNGYWTPSRAMKAAGFQHVSCGKDGPKARAEALKWVSRWNAFKAGQAVDLEAWPEGSLGEAFERFRSLGEWERKKPRTREDWERGWALIKPIFGDVRPAKVTLEDISLWYSGDPSDTEIKGVLTTVGVREAHRAVKIWRALWQVAAALGYCNSEKDPSFGIRRQTPAPREARWSEGEVVRLVKQAIRMGFHDLACILAVLWDTQFSPVDGRTLRARHIVRENRLTFRLDRTKSGRAVIGTLSRRTEALLEAHLAKITVEMHPDALLFHTREGAAYTKDLLPKDFRVVRRALFGRGETRQIQDMRRSGAVEALAGRVDPAALAHKMGNTINQSKELQRAYLPVDATVVAMADQARIVGRRRLREGGK